MNSRSKKDIISDAFDSYMAVVDDSPMGDAKFIQDEESVFLRFHDESGDTILMEFEDSAFENACFVGDSVWLKDKTGLEVQISFYETKPVQLVEYQELPIKSSEDIVAEAKTKGELLVTRAHPPVKAFQFNINTPQEQQLEGLEVDAESTKAFGILAYRYQTTGFYGDEADTCLIDADGDGGWLLGPYPDGGYWFVGDLEKDGYVPVEQEAEAQTMSFTSKPADECSQAFSGSVTVGDCLVVQVEGYSDYTSDDQNGAVLVIEKYNGELRAINYGDINSEEPTEIISLEGARVSDRNPPEPSYTNFYHCCGEDWKLQDCNEIYAYPCDTCSKDVEPYKSEPSA